MAMSSVQHFSFFFVVFLCNRYHSVAEAAGTVGVNYGRVANNLPPADKVVELLKAQGINQIKLYDADPVVLRSLAGTGIGVVVTLPNEQLASAAARPEFAASWVRRSVASHLPATLIKAVCVGNEVFADRRNLTSFLVPAMSNVHAALADLRLDSAVKVSSPITLTALQSSYPCSAGSFRQDLAGPVIRPMLELLRRSGSPLMVNAYPFFAFAGAGAGEISLDYALFRPNAGVADSGTGLRYYNLLDAQIDAVFAAMASLGYSDVPVVVSETGWPSNGDAKETVAGASKANAAAYNGNLVRRVLSGNSCTPMRPTTDIDVYLFALFNENQKPGPASERNYGLFYPDETKVYDIEFSLSGAGAGGGLKWQEEPPAAGKGGAGEVGERWCVANAVVGRERLQAALDYACGYGGADCRKIQPGGDCYMPDTTVAHASWAFNSYYQRVGRAAGSCDFAGAAFVVSGQSPRIGGCALPSRA